MAVAPLNNSQDSRRISCFRVSGETADRLASIEGFSIDHLGPPLLTIDYPSPPGPEESILIAPQPDPDGNAEQLVVVVEAGQSARSYLLGGNQAGSLELGNTARSFVVVAYSLPSRPGGRRKAHILEAGRPELAVDGQGRGLAPTRQGHEVQPWASQVLQRAGFDVPQVIQRSAEAWEGTEFDDAVVQLLQEHFGATDRLLVIFSE